MECAAVDFECGAIRVVVYHQSPLIIAGLGFGKWWCYKLVANSKGRVWRTVVRGALSAVSDDRATTMSDDCSAKGNFLIKATSRCSLLFVALSGHGGLARPNITCRYKSLSV
ncbi:hypothetical protein GOBAR_DD00142 [Gossypium barbadense]|nr:hypothetical protein GOBAR_DD00142 [Gossypium barbadense]